MAGACEEWKGGWCGWLRVSEGESRGGETKSKEGEISVCKAL